MLSGDEEALRRRALASSLDTLQVAPDDFDVSTLDGSVHPREWLAQAATVPFLGDYRVLIVRHLLRSDPDLAKGLDLKGLPPTAKVILVADEEQGDENRQSRLKTIRKNWEKLVESQAGTVERFDVTPKELSAAIKAEVERYGKKITDRCTNLLAEMVGGSLSRATEELEKLVLYIGEQQMVEESAIKAVVVPAREWNVFKLSDSITRGDVGEAIRQLRILVVSPVKAEEAAFRNVLPQLSRQFKLLWQARLCVDAKTSPNMASSAMMEGFPTRPDLTKEPPYRQTALMSSARGTSLSNLAQCFRILADTDARLKGQLPSYSAMETLERMVLEMGNLFISGTGR